MTPTKPEPSRRRSALTRDRAAKRYPLPAIEHGLDILLRLDQHLFLTNDQIERLLFTDGPTTGGKARSAKGAPYAANTALRRLFDAGYINRVPVFLPSPVRRAVKPGFVNVLSAKGAKEAAAIISNQGAVPRWRRSLLPRPWQPALHGHWIREVAIWNEATCRQLGYRWWNWLDDRQMAALKKTHGARYETIPDGFAMITNPATGKHFPHFFEIDLGSETVSARSPARADWRGKVESYVSYLKEGFREQFGVATMPVILTVTESERRLTHLLEATVRAGGGGRFWFTTLDHLTRCVTPASASPAAPEGLLQAPIWRTPVDGQPRRLIDRMGGLV